MTPPVKLATDGTSLKHPHPDNSEWRFQRVDQRVLRGGDHLTTDCQEHEPRTKLRCAEQEQLEQVWY